MTLKKQHVIRLCVLFSVPLPWHAVASSTPPDAYAARANMAFKSGADSGLSPMTPPQMAMCKTHWDRWKYFVDSSNVPAFNNSLSLELSSKSAKKTAAIWLRKSKKAYRRYGDEMGDFATMLAEANEQADTSYSRLMGNDPEAAISFPKTLGTCRSAK